MRSKSSWIIMGLIGLYGLFWLSLGILYGGLLASRVAETPQSVDTPVGVMCTAIPAYYMENGLLYDGDKLYAEQDALLTKIEALPEDYDGEMPT